MEYIVKLGIRCQQVKSPDLRVDCAEDLEFMLTIDDGGEAILEALVSSGLVDPEGSIYTCTFFIEMNGQLLSNWRNGEMRAKQSNPNQSNPKKSNSTQSKPIQSKSTVCLSNAQAMLTEKAIEDYTDDSDGPF